MQEVTNRETPDWLISKMMGMAAIRDGLRILEPSAGDGKMVRHLIENYTFTGLVIQMVELNASRYHRLVQNVIDLHAKTDAEVMFSNGDYLQSKFTKGFDRIIACPPFKAGADMDHITKMYEDLAPKGIMVSLTSPFWLTNNDPRQCAFREWLSDRDHELRVIPDMTFSERGRSVATSILKINKKKQ